MRRRVFAAGRERRGASVEMAPLIDMVFILLIFFMVSTTFIRESGVDVSRPESSFAESIDQGFVSVAIDARGGVHVGGKVIPADSVRGIAAAMDEAGKRRIVIQADRSVVTELLLKVLDTCKLAGAKQVDVAAIKP